MPSPQEQLERLAAQLPIGRDPVSVRRRLEAMEALLERVFVVPGINRPVGLDAIVGLIPVVGDLVTTAMGAWLIWEGRNLGLSKFHLARMAGNVGVDTLIGAIPLVGDLFDFAFRSNSRNLRILKRWLDKHHPETQLIEGEVLSSSSGQEEPSEGAPSEEEAGLAADRSANQRRASGVKRK